MFHQLSSKAKAFHLEKEDSFRPAGKHFMLVLSGLHPEILNDIG